MKQIRGKCWVGGLLGVAVASVVVAQGPDRQRRQHVANESNPVQTLQANQRAPGSNQVRIYVKGNVRVIEANGIPNHGVGAFPNRGNPNSISEQSYSFELPLHPKAVTRLQETRDDGQPPRNAGMPFGIALNGVVFDPGTAEFWQGDRRSGWNYEALGGAVPLGVDDHYAHVQPTGAYHYHGLPTGFLQGLQLHNRTHSPLVGWAADGFPIYARYGYRDGGKEASGVVELRSSYRLKRGERPAEPNGPGGQYDGAFTQDYEFVDGLGDLDECNGRFTISPEFPNGTYAYFLTQEWPVVPRQFKGTPVNFRGEGDRGARHGFPGENAQDGAHRHGERRGGPPPPHGHRHPPR